MNLRVLAVVVALVVIGAGAVVVAGRADPDEVVASVDPSPRAPVEVEQLPVIEPEWPDWEADGWLNSEPLDDADLVGNVVLYDFWTFGCYNCENTLPWVTAWHERYTDDGLVLLSVHTAEFDWEKDEGRIADYLVEHDIRYPVALDHDRDIWRAFGNHWWPAFYLFDREGRQRYFHKGEGRYDTTEATIRALLGVAEDSPWADTP